MVNEFRIQDLKPDVLRAIPGQGTTNFKNRSTTVNASALINALLGLQDRSREEEERQTLEDILAQRLGESVGLKDIPAKEDSNILESIVPAPRGGVGGPPTVYSSPHGPTGAGRFGEDQEVYPTSQELPPSTSSLEGGPTTPPRTRPGKTAAQQFQEKYGRTGITYLREYAKHVQLKERQDLERMAKAKIDKTAATELERTEIAKFKRDDLAKRTAVLQKQGFDQRTAKVLLQSQESLAKAKDLSARNLEILKNDLNPPQKNFEEFITAAMTVINSDAAPAVKEKAQGDIEFIKKHKIAIALAGKPITNMKMIPAGALDKLIGFQDLQNDLTRAMEYFHPDYTGPLNSKFGDIRQATGFITDEEIKFRQTVKFIEEIFSRKQTGAVISPEERPGFKALVPTLGDKSNVFLTKRSHFFDLMQDRVNTRVSTYSQFLFGNVPESEVTNALTQKRSEKTDGGDVSQVSTDVLLQRNNIRLPSKKK
jgi:hypothetical protein